jgi:hypothetical protein
MDGGGIRSGGSGGERLVDGSSDGPVEVAGAAQKGPFLAGSRVDVGMIDNAANPTGTVYLTMTNNDRGEFNVTVATPGPAELITTGFYFNEISGVLSTSMIEMRAIVDISGSGTQQIYVNSITHMAERRGKSLMADGATVTDAVTQAESELRAALGLFVPASVGAGTTLNLLGGDMDANAYLFAVSCILGQTALNEGSPSLDAELQELINSIAIDLEPDGLLDTALVDRLAEGERLLDPKLCSRNMQARLDELGSTATLPDLDRALDFDRDGTSDFLDDDDDGDGLVGAADTITGFATAGAAASVGRKSWTLAVDASGTVWGWGTNDLAQLGAAGPAWWSPPLLVPLLADVVQVAALDPGSSFAIKSDGTVWGWGSGDATPMEITSFAGASTGAGALARGRAGITCGWSRRTARSGSVQRQRCR